MFVDKKLGIFAGGVILAVAIGATSIASFAQSSNPSLPQKATGARITQPSPGRNLPPQQPTVPQPGDAGPRGQGQGQGPMMMGGGGGVTMVVEGNFLYILRGNQLLKVSTSDLKVVATGNLPVPQMRNPQPGGPPPEGVVPGGPPPVTSSPGRSGN